MCAIPTIVPKIVDRCGQLSKNIVAVTNKNEKNGIKFRHVLILQLFRSTMKITLINIVKHYKMYKKRTEKRIS